VKTFQVSTTLINSRARVYSMKWMNKTLFLLMLSDVLVLTGFGLTAPILAIYIKDGLKGSLLSVGIASMIFFIMKAAVQIPFSRYIDGHKRRKKWLIGGTFLIAIVPFIYMFSKSVEMMYIAQFIYGLGAGMAAASWLAVWSNHLDKHHESFEWSTYTAAIGLFSGLAAIIGAYLSQYMGFRGTFIVVGILALIGCYILFYLEDKTIVPSELLHFHKKRKIHH
jgi:MFS transporter, DHA1 family, multidrug resistance protein